MPDAGEFRHVVDELIAAPPAFHQDRGEPQIWNARGQTLAYIARVTRPGDRTLEVGVGASTVVFAAAAAHHTAIGPVASEHRTVRRYCLERGVPINRLDLVEGYSEEVLPGFYPERELDIAFIDGKHSFPHPIIDWHYVSNILRVGGLLLIDDLAAPAVEMLCRVMLADSGWQLEGVPDCEAVAFRKLAVAQPGDPWQEQRVASSAELETQIRRVTDRGSSTHRESAIGGARFMRAGLSKLARALTSSGARSREHE